MITLRDENSSPFEGLSNHEDCCLKREDRIEAIDDNLRIVARRGVRKNRDGCFTDFQFSWAAAWRVSSCSAQAAT
jgi:hypothetical protein